MTIKYLKKAIKNPSTDDTKTRNTVQNILNDIDKRREEAIKELELPIYDENQLKLDKEFVLKKLELNESTFHTVLSTSMVPHSTFKTEKSIFQHYPIFKLFRPLFKWVKNK